jgi:hypothetical protein
MNKQSLTIASYVIAAVFVVVGIIYFVTPANNLPAFFPGHDAAMTKAHTKHGLAAIILALGAVAFGWFQSGPRSPQE